MHLLFVCLTECKDFQSKYEVSNLCGYDCPRIFLGICYDLIWRHYLDGFVFRF